MANANESTIILTRQVERKLIGEKKLIKEHILSFYEKLFTER